MTEGAKQTFNFTVNLEQSNDDGNDDVTMVMIVLTMIAMTVAKSMTTTLSAKHDPSSTNLNVRTSSGNYFTIGSQFLTTKTFSVSRIQKNSEQWLTSQSRKNNNNSNRQAV